MKVSQTIGNGAKQETVLTVKQRNGEYRFVTATMYQFGRKDAYPGHTRYNTVAEGFWTGSYGLEYGEISPANGILHPEIFYYGFPFERNYNYYNLWSANCKTPGINNDVVIKTVYDPCPPGLHMPASKAFTGFTTTGTDALNNVSEINAVDNSSETFDDLHGWEFWTNSSKTEFIYFPATGLRAYTGGAALDYPGLVSHWWTAIPADIERGYNAYIARAHMKPYQYGTQSRGYGFAVRPVGD